MASIIKTVLVLWLLSLTLTSNFHELRQYMTPTQQDFSGLFVLRWPAAFCEYLSFRKNGACLP